MAAPTLPGTDASALVAVLARQERASARVGLGLCLAIAGALELTGVRSVDRGAALVLVTHSASAAAQADRVLHLHSDGIT